MPRVPWQERLFRSLLRLFPAEFRGDFGDQMSEDFRDQRQDTRGRVASVRLWLSTLLGIGRQAPREHLDLLVRDAGYALRVLRRRPGFAATALLTIAVGIGLNAAVFNVLHGVLLQPLELPSSDRIVRIFEVTPRPDIRPTAVSPANLLDWQAQVTTLDAVAGVSRHPGLTIAIGADAEELVAAAVTDAFFTMLQPPLALGRLFTPAEYEAMVPSIGANGRSLVPEPGVAILSHSLWQRQFGGRADVLGSRIRMRSGTAEIVGVLAPGFQVPDWADVDCWLPDAMDPLQRRARWVAAYGRIAPGADLAAVQTELHVIATRLADMYPDANEGRGVRVMSLLDSMTAHVSLRLWFLFAAAACVLLIVCANLANLLLAHLSGRRRELTIRYAIGASRAHVVRQSVTEGLVLAWSGGAIGLALAAWTLPILVALAPPDMPRLTEIRVSGSVVLFTVAISTMVGIGCGLASMAFVRAANPAHASTLAARGRWTTGRGLRHGLIVAEVALALVLVIAAGLLVKTMRAIGGLELGFEPRSALSVGLMPHMADLEGYRSAMRRVQFEAELVTRVRELPGVVAAGIGSRPIGGGVMGSSITLATAPDTRIPISVDAVGPGYLEALGAELRAGRFFTDADGASGPRVAVVSEAAARQLWPDTGAIGQRFSMDEGELEVIGVLGDVRRGPLEQPPPATVYMASAQTRMIWSNNMLVRTRGDPRDLVPALRAVMREIDPNQALTRIQTLDERLADATAPRRFTFRLVGTFSVLALGLAILGIYGVISESVAERVPEIGVRMALGATPSHVVRMIVQHGLGMVLAGLAIGIAAAAALNRTMATLVFGVETTDVIVYAIASACLLLTMLAGSLLPAWRAATIDPLAALREE